VGNHALKITTDTGYHRPKVQQIFVAEQSSQNIDAQLEVITGALVIGSQPPGAEILIDGESRGTTPLKLAALPIGVRRLEARKKGFTPRVMEVVVREGDSRVTNIELLTLGSIEVTCKAPEADLAGVTIHMGQDAPIRSATHRFEQVATGIHTVTCTSPKGHFVSEKITVSPGEMERRTFDLNDPSVLLAAWEDKRSGYIWGTRGLIALGLGAGIYGAMQYSEAGTQDDELAAAQGRFLSAVGEEDLALAKADVLTAQSGRNDAANMATLGLGLAGASLVGAVVTYLMAPERPNVGKYADGPPPGTPRLSFSLLPSARPGLWLGVGF
jgi:hypothetical protein